jgi:hypothetical protein
VETETTPKRAGRGGGRPSIGPAFALRLPPEWGPALDAVARERQTSRSAVIRQALAEAYPEYLPEGVDTSAPRYAPRIAYPE